MRLVDFEHVYTKMETNFHQTVGFFVRMEYPLTKCDKAQMAERCRVLGSSVCFIFEFLW